MAKLTEPPLGDYLKGLERGETDRRGAPGEAVYLRIDGNRFSKFTKGMRRPFDERMSAAMVDTAKGLVHEFGAAIGYTQSDEISLILWESSPESELVHGGKFHKLVSRTASKATHLFYRAALAHGLAEFVDRQFPEFDARAFACSTEDAGKCILWRWIDARKNAIQMLAQSHFSAKQLHGKHGDAMLEMLAAKGVVFDDYPRSFREGTLLRRVTVMRDMTTEEMGRIPAEHRPTGPIERTDIIAADIPDLYTPAGRAALQDGQA